jgi:2,3-diketo-5-methylthiopentyl-1-phosphate enolase
VTAPAGSGPLLNPPDSVVATYRFATGRASEGQATLDEIRRAAEAFAVGQSVGTWIPVPGLTAELMERHGAHVLRVVPAAEAGTDVEIAFPSLNFRDGGLPMLMTALLGNDPSTGIAATLIDLALPPEYVHEFGGLRVGIAGWRARLGVHGRPLVLNPMKPCIGLFPQATADIAAEVARGGVDLVKDDEVLGDTSFSRVAERCRAVSAALDRVAEETGHRTRYVVSITDRARRMRDHVHAARENGADGVMVAAFLVGLDAVQEVVEELDGALPVIAHTAGLDLFGGSNGLGVAPEVLVGRLARLAGADGVLIGSPWARRSTPEPLWLRMAALLRDEWSGLTPAFPIVGGGIVPEQLGEVVRMLGIEVIVTAGGAINGHPDGAEAGARAMMDALDEAVAAARGPV